MKKIELTQSKSVIVDDWNYDWLMQWDWYALKNQSAKSTRWYAVRKAKGKDKQIFMHREIMKTPEGMEVDHKDHNGLNCLEENMRNCTHLLNGKNRAAYGKSKYLGVNFYYDKHGKEYIRAVIRVDGKQRYLGTFTTEKDAAMAYDRAAIEFHGSYANLNILQL
jgi:hypothetical protein